MSGGPRSGPNDRRWLRGRRFTTTRTTSTLPQDRSHPDARYVTAKFGVQPNAAGPRQKYRCTARDGGVHYFVGAAPGDDGATLVDALNERHHRRKHDVACPRRAHAQRKIRYKGKRTTAAGVTWAKFQCIPAAGNGKSHYFSVLRSVTGSAIATLNNPPGCADHELSAVVRNGRHGRPGTVRKQSYRCTPADGSDVHYFMTPLPREEVHAGVATCSVCDELLSPHRGVVSGARHTSWTMKNLAQALNDLSTGSSYATVSMEMQQRRETARRHLESHLHGHDGPQALSEDAPETKSQSWTAEQSKNSWHLAADLVEQYSHLFFDKVNAEMLAREARLREGNDALLAANPEWACPRRSSTATPPSEGVVHADDIVPPSRHVGALFLALPWVCRQVDGLCAHKRSSAAGTVEKDDGHHVGRYQDEEQ